MRQKETKYTRLYALLPEVQLTRDSRDREEEEVGGGVEQLPSPATRRLQRRLDGSGGGGRRRTIEERLHAFDLWRRVDVVLSFSD